jgi:hypothetical protein
MKVRQTPVANWMTVTLFMAVSAPAWAQSGAIVGTVKDESGAAVPGVTVEASSPALIAGTKEATTSKDGTYQILDLPPGPYAVLFSVSGFQSLRREGVALRTAFTATIDATLKIGTLDEVVTVSGAAPVVDVKSSVTETVLTDAVKEGLPTGRTVGAMLALVPGVTQSTVDLGGTEALAGTGGSPMIHGSDSSDITWNMDGGDITSVRGGGGTAGAYYNEGLHEEISIQTRALPAEVAAGGISFNMVSKTGGNTFKGYLFASGTNDSLQSNNLTDDLQARGLRAPTRVSKVYDFNPGFGGPIVKDRLWFYASYRRQVVNRYQAGVFRADGTQAPDDNDNTQLSGSITAQITKHNRLSASYDQAWKQNYNTRTGSGQCVSYPAIVEDSATYLQPTQPHQGSLKWTSTITNNFQIEVGGSLQHIYFGHPEREGNGTLTQVDLVRGTISGASACEADDWPVRRTGSVIASYSPNWHGTHNIRAGVQYQYNTMHEITPSNGARGDWAAFYRNGVPDSVQVFNTPTEINERWTDLGVFVQDSWTIKSRLTINAGVRFERLVGQLDRQTAPAGRWIGARDYPEVPDVPNWTTVVPRMALVYDLTGKGKTALKVNASQYTQKIGESFIGLINPMSNQRDTRAWNDLNRDLVPQVNELGPSTGFSGGVSTRYASDLRRPKQWEFTASIQHELFKSVGVTVTYYRRDYSDTIGTKNLAVPSSAYTPATIINPLTGEPLTVYNQDPATRGRIDSVRDNYEGIERSYNGFEAVVEKRFAAGFMMIAGVTLGAKKGTVNTSDLNNPNLLINNYGNLDTDAKRIVNVSAIYHLPWKLILSGHLNHRTGFPLQRNLSVGRTLVPNLTQVTQTVVLVPRGDVRLPSLNLLDFRLARAFSAGNRVTIEPIVDVYNVFNSGTVLAEVQTVGPSLGRVSDTLGGRLVRLGLKASF